MQGPVSEAQYREFLKVFQAFHTPSDLATLPLMASPLVQQARQQQPTLLPHQALQAVFTEIITLLAAENQTYADLLQGRFWEGQSIEAMVAAERPLAMSKRTFSNYQRSAIQTFAFLFLQAENNLLTQPATPTQAELPPPETPNTQPAPLTLTVPISAPQPTHPAHQPVLALALPTASHHLASPRTTQRSEVLLPPPRPHVPWRLSAALVLAVVLVVGLVGATRVGRLLGNAVASTPALLFADDFEQGAAQWNTDSAAWAIETDASGNHFYCVDQTGPAYTYALAGNTTWQDYTLQLDLKIVDSAPGGSGNILWRVADADATHYLLGLLAEVEGGNMTLAREDPRYLPLGQSLQRLPHQQWVPIRITITGGEMQIFVNNAPQPTLQVTDPNPIPHGGIGLGAGFDPNAPGGQWKICFDNVRVMEKSAPE